MKLSLAKYKAWCIPFGGTGTRRYVATSFPSSFYGACFTTFKNSLHQATLQVWYTLGHSNRLLGAHRFVILSPPLPPPPPPPPPPPHNIVRAPPPPPPPHNIVRGFGAIHAGMKRPRTRAVLGERAGLKPDKWASSILMSRMAVTMVTIKTLVSGGGGGGGIRHAQASSSPFCSCFLLVWNRDLHRKWTTPARITCAQRGRCARSCTTICFRCQWPPVMRLARITPRVRSLYRF